MLYKGYLLLLSWQSSEVGTTIIPSSVDEDMDTQRD